MQKLIVSIAVALLATFSGPSAQAQASERNPPVVTIQDYFGDRLGKLRTGIEKKDNASIERYESELVGAMRAISTSDDAVKEAKKDKKGAEFVKKTADIIQQFEGFTFTTASQTEIDAHLKLLESFLTLM